MGPRQLRFTCSDPFSLYREASHCAKTGFSAPQKHFPRCIHTLWQVRTCREFSCTKYYTNCLFFTRKYVLCLSSLYVTLSSAPECAGCVYWGMPIRCLQHLPLCACFLFQTMVLHAMNHSCGQPRLSCAHTPVDCYFRRLIHASATGPQGT